MIQLLHTLLFFSIFQVCFCLVFLWQVHKGNQSSYINILIGIGAEIWDILLLLFLVKWLGISYPFKLLGCQHAVREEDLNPQEVGSQGIWLSRFCRPRLGVDALWWWRGRGCRIVGSTGPEQAGEADRSLLSAGLIASLPGTLCVCPILFFKWFILRKGSASQVTVSAGRLPRLCTFCCLCQRNTRLYEDTHTHTHTHTPLLAHTRAHTPAGTLSHVHTDTCKHTLLYIFICISPYKWTLIYKNIWLYSKIDSIYNYTWIYFYAKGSMYLLSSLSIV